MIVPNDSGGEAAGLVGNRDYQAYLARVGADWRLLDEAVGRGRAAGTVSGELWQAFAGDYGGWTQFYDANKDPILPVVATGDLDAWADRAKAWDEKLKAAGAGGVPGPGVSGAIPGSVGTMAAQAADVARTVFWLTAAGAGVWLLLKYGKGSRR